MTTNEIQSPKPDLLPLEQQRFRVQYQTYFKGKRQNFFRTMTEFKDLWDGLQLLNDIWMRELSNLEHLREATQMLPKLLFAAAHARFLTALELGFCCCIGDAYSILRDGIETVAHAYKISSEPTTGPVWISKHKGKAEEVAYLKIFEKKKKENLFPEKHGLRELHKYYGQFSEMATHTSAASVGRGFKESSTAGNTRWEFHYFETDPQRLAGLLLALLQVSSRMEEVFYVCFETRQDLDPDLARMRAEFRQIREQQRRYLRETYKLG
jgi:hypothetical protein